MTEVWKDIHGYEGLYQVSNLGNVKSLKRVTIRSDERKHTVAESTLSHSPHSISGHIRVNLRCGSRTETKWVHQLVANHFLPPPDFENPEVCHRDGVPSNNCYLNLRWGTRKDNTEDRRIHGTLIRGELATGAKLTESQVRVIKSKLESGQSGVSIATEFGMSQMAISQIKTGKRWVHV